MALIRSTAGEGKKEALSLSIVPTDSKNVQKNKVLKALHTLCQNEQFNSKEIDLNTWAEAVLKLITQITSSKQIKSEPAKKQDTTKQLTAKLHELSNKELLQFNVHLPVCLGYDHNEKEFSPEQLLQQVRFARLMPAVVKMLFPESNESIQVNVKGYFAPRNIDALEDWQKVPHAKELITELNKNVSEKPMPDVNIEQWFDRNLDLVRELRMTKEDCKKLQPFNSLSGGMVLTPLWHESQAYKNALVILSQLQQNQPAEYKKVMDLLEEQVASTRERINKHYPTHPKTEEDIRAHLFENIKVILSMYTKPKASSLNVVLYPGSIDSYVKKALELAFREEKIAGNLIHVHPKAKPEKIAKPTLTSVQPELAPIAKVPQGDTIINKPKDEQAEKDRLVAFFLQQVQTFSVLIKMAGVGRVAALFYDVVPTIDPGPTYHPKAAIKLNLDYLGRSGVFASPRKTPDVFTIFSPPEYVP